MGESIQVSWEVEDEEDYEEDTSGFHKPSKEEKTQSLLLKYQRVMQSRLDSLFKKKSLMTPYKVTDVKVLKKDKVLVFKLKVSV